MIKKISVIDLGYNSLKLVNYIIQNNKYNISSQKSFKVKLGENLHSQKILKDDAINRTINALNYFKEIIYFNSSSSLVIPFATSAVRESENQKNFLNKIYDETGFKFKVLSEKKEAIYSYIGANNSLCFPDCIFFDLGGGSLEIVSTKKFTIRKIISLPLGSLKLSQSFFNNGDNYKTSKNELKKLEEYVFKSLPSRDDLDISSNCVNLIGVGGVLRTIAQFDQSIKEYPIQKLHNYYLDQNSIVSIYDHLKNMSYDEILKIDEIGKNRVDTIVTGSCVIKNLITKFKVKNLVVSTKGLREGILLYNTNLYTQKISTKNQKSNLLKKLIVDTCSNQFYKSMSKYFNKLLTLLLNHNEIKILNIALSLIYNNSNFYNGNNDISYLKHKFFSIMNSDNHIISNLTHKDQVLLSLSIISIHKSKIISILMEHLNNLFRSKEEKAIFIQTIEKINTCIELILLLNKLNSNIKIKTRTNKNKKFVYINIILKKKIKIKPTISLNNIFKNIEDTSNLCISYYITNNTKKMIKEEESNNQ